uniref:DNA_MISMATCH_REPAIR_2 domain-containing protein n=1 Tax=Heterorhabditis bacteriophora TaxID=37862 RepID=A0A1I7XU16_HETBA
MFGEDYRYFNNIRGAELVKQLANKEISNCDALILQKQLCMSCCAALLKYIEHIQNIVFSSGALRFTFKDVENMCMIDLGSWKNLEIVDEFLSKDHRSLMSIINKTLTPSGARLLRSNLLQPSTDKPLIEARLDAVEELIDDPHLLERLRKIIARVHELDHVLAMFIRTNSEVTVQSAEYNITQLLHLRRTLHIVEPLRQVLSNVKSQLLVNNKNHLNDSRLDELIEILDDRINSDVLSTNKKNSITIRNQKCYAVKIFINEVRNRSSITFTSRSLIRYNDRIEQSVCEVLLAGDIVIQQIIENMRPHAAVLYYVMDAIANIDFLCSLAVYASTTQSVRPRFGTSVMLKGARHPLLDHSMPDRVVPNDTYLTPDSRFAIITGPNMAGKSTYLKQVSQLCLMAQMGSMVPAQIAVLPIFTRVFSRIGHNDCLAQNLSAFAVEMSEMAVILQYANERSLIVIDELARSKLSLYLIYCKSIFSGDRII